jgi:hypothetical protein
MILVVVDALLMRTLMSNVILDLHQEEGDIVKCKLISEIDGLELYNNYLIYEDDTIISLFRQWGRYVTYKKLIMKSKMSKNGYRTIILTRNEVKKYMTIHRLVALAFIPNIDNKLQVNHIDGDKSNNHVNNLEWCTSNENINHANNLGLFKKLDKHPNAKLTNRQVNEIKELLKLTDILIIDIAKLYNVTANSISHINTGKTWIIKDYSYPIRKGGGNND